MEFLDSITAVRASLAEAEKMAAEYAVAMYAEAQQAPIRLQRLKTAFKAPDCDEADPPQTGSDDSW